MKIMKPVFKKATGILLFLLFMFGIILSAQSSDSTQQAVASKSDSIMILKYKGGILRISKDDKIAQIIKGDKLKVWVKGESLKGKFTTFKNDSVSISSDNGFRNLHVNAIRKIRVYDTRSGRVKLGKVFSTGGNVTYGISGIALAAGIEGIINKHLGAISYFCSSNRSNWFRD